MEPLHLRPANGREDKMLAREHLDKARELDRELARYEEAIKLVQQTDPDNLTVQLTVRNKSHPAGAIGFGVTADDTLSILEREAEALRQNLERLGVRVTP